MQKKVAVIAVSFFLVLFLTGCSLKGSEKKDENKAPAGNEQQQKSGDKKQGNVPVEMTTACSGKSEGDACEITMSQGKNKISGTCKKDPQGEQLSCMPEGRQDGSGGPGREKPTEK